MTEARSYLERAALAGLLVFALLGSGVPGSLPAAGLAAVVCAIAVALKPLEMAASMRRALQGVGDGLVGAAAVLGFLWTVYPVVSEATLLRIATPLTFALASLGIVALASSPRWPPARTLVPASLGQLVIGALPSPPGWRLSACIGGAAASVVLFLLVERRAFDRRDVLRRLWALAAFAAATAGIGLGIARFLPWAQPQVEAATVSLLATNAGSGYAGFSPTSRLGDIEELALSSRVVLRAFTDTPQRLRGRVFTRFDGRAWAAEPARETADLVAANTAALPPPLPRFFEEVPGSVLSAPGLGLLQSRAPLVRTRIVQSTTEIQTLLAPIAPLLVGMARGGASLDDLGIVTPSPAGAVEIYAIANRYGGPGPGHAAPESTLQLPPSPDPRILALAETLGGTSGSAEEKLRRTGYHLERCCRYSLKVPRATSRDPVAGFLFETRRGYCEYFATSAALLLRLQGVPTRYVTGFNVRDESLVGTHYAVRESDAHAWVESYLPGGWVEFDPTPSAQYAEVHKDSQPGAMTALLERVLALASEVWARLRAGSLLSSARWALRRAAPALLAMVSIAAAMLLRRLLSRRAQSAMPRRPGEQELDPGIRELLVRVDALLRRRGHTRPAARAPLEHLESLKEGALPGPLKNDAARAVECFYLARYGGVRPPADEVRGLLGRLPTA